jgi:hypothetical protein
MHTDLHTASFERTIAARNEASNVPDQYDALATRQLFPCLSCTPGVQARRLATLYTHGYMYGESPSTQEVLGEKYAKHREELIAGCRKLADHGSSIREPTLIV